MRSRIFFWHDEPLRSSFLNDPVLFQIIQHILEETREIASTSKKHLKGLYYAPDKSERMFIFKVFYILKRHASCAGALSMAK